MFGDDDDTQSKTTQNKCELTQTKKWVLCTLCMGEPLDDDYITFFMSVQGLIISFTNLRSHQKIYE